MKSFSIIDKLSENSDHLPQVFEILKKDQLPIVMFGAGALGRYFLEIFQTAGVRIDHVVANRIYWRENLMLEDKPVEILEEILQRYDQVNVFCALQYLQPIKKLESQLIDSCRVKHFFTYDTGCIHYGYRDLTIDFVRQCEQDFEWIYNELADELSRSTLLAYLNQRISGRVGYLERVLDRDHLFPKDLIALNDEEVFVDCGAFDGKTIQDFVVALRAQGRSLNQPIYALEPDAMNREMIHRNCANLTSLTIIPRGAWNENGFLSFAHGGGATSRLLESGTGNISVDRIDNLLKDKKITYLKLDVEGAELNALKGAAQCISQFKPKIGVCVYHRSIDLVTIPKFIKNIVPEYKLYLRAHSIGANDLLLYCLL